MKSMINIAKEAGALSKNDSTNLPKTTPCIPKLYSENEKAHFILLLKRNSSIRKQEKQEKEFGEKFTGKEKQTPQILKFKQKIHDPVYNYDTYRESYFIVYDIELDIENEKVHFNIRTGLNCETSSHLFLEYLILNDKIFPIEEFPALEINV